MKQAIHLAVLLAYSATTLAAADVAPAVYQLEAGGSARSWQYRPVVRPAVPAVKQKNWVLTPIDAFVLAKLEAKGLAPAPDADRATFIRRATLDAWGLIPSPEEVKAFVADKSPKAYEKLVDRLLASPRYGERQGRRWLDLTRYADSDGFNADGTRPNIWRYRDYVIQSLNQDKPFDRFVKEQVAGDELYPGNREALIATGFLRNYPDEINARDLNLKQVEVATDLTDTVGSVFLATTVGCAACHNHKFDKISQKEYYQLQAFFVNASAEDDILAVDGKDKADYEAKLAKWEAATKPIREQQEAILKPVLDKAEEDRLQGFTPATREAIAKPEAERNAYERWIYHRSRWTLSGRFRNAANTLKTKDKPAYEKYQKLTEQLKDYDYLKPKHPGYISAMTELGHADAPPTYVLANGIYDRRLEEVQPAVPALLTSKQPQIRPTATSSGRRAALAEWLASADNPLTARVFVNRIWGQYFGRAIVETVSDFGKMSTRPSHPELLDWLADDFVKQGWSIKRLHRQILLSHVYRQSSDQRADTRKTDPDNRLLASFPRLRMEAEEIRDSLLLASGLLNETLGGPAVFPPVPANFNAALNQANFWKTSDNPRDYYRRSVYVFIRRNSPYPLLDTFDWANPQLVHHKREVTTTAPQALALVNSDQVFEWSQALAGRIVKEAKGEPAQIERLYQILYSRSPDKFEKATLTAFLDQQEKLALDKLEHGKKTALPRGYDENPAIGGQLDRLYQAVYGRSADKFEKAAFVEYLDKQRKKFGSNGAAGGDDDDDAGGAGGTVGAVKVKDPADTARRARASAFVSLVHAVANSNEFSYRF